MSAVIRGEGLAWSRPGGQVVLEDASLQIQRGELVCISGPSGTGKSVLGSLLLRLRPISTGRVWWGEVEVTSRNPASIQPLRAQYQGLLQQTAAVLPPFLTVGDALRETLSAVAGLRGREAADRLAEVTRLLGMGDLLHRGPRYLSGGEQRKAGVARLLLTAPSFAFVDEPDAGLDPVSQHDVMGELRRAVDRTGMGMLVVTHNAMLSERYADRRLLLSEGALRAA